MTSAAGSPVAPGTPAAPVFLGVSLKTYFDHRQTVEWAAKLVEAGRAWSVSPEEVEIVLLPSFPSIPAVAQAVGSAGVKVGAQNLSQFGAGPYTGEVWGRSLAQVGCSYVELGHAERRALFGETDAVVQSKVAAAIASGLIPLICVGEAAQTSPGEAAELCVRQFANALGGVSSPPQLVLAYEPIWAIGSKDPAPAEHIDCVAQALHAWARRHCLGSTIRVIYGGTAGPGTLSSLGSSVDGLFLGRRVHDPCAFRQIVAEAEIRARNRVGTISVARRTE
ncbi:MAG: triose-phosphate isomerase [Bifidobacteriaceae bacterium]|nr:triose-phosphate isomerase [Bifidobacteriaceae bacterium]